MRRSRISAALLAAVLVLSIPLLVSAQTAERQEQPPAAPDRQQSPMMQEIHDLLADARAELADLEADYRAAAGPERNELEKRIATLKIETEIAVLETQLRSARAAGRSGDDVRRLEESVAALSAAPRSKASPRPRAEPGAER